LLLQLQVLACGQCLTWLAGDLDPGEGVELNKRHDLHMSLAQTSNVTGASGGGQVPVRVGSQG
jgi:hypothetical protein